MKFTQSSKQAKMKSQAGLASIIVTMIIMIIISLIVLAAAQLSRREQRQALDRQLSTQAFYAAESGVNDVVKALEGNLGLLTGEYTAECDDFESAVNAATPNTIVPQLDGDNTKYSCLLVDPSPTSWEGDIGETAQIIPIKDKNGAAIQRIDIAWQQKEGGTNFNCPLNPDQPPNDNWTCDTPMLRIDLVPTVGSVTRTTLNNNVKTAFLRPGAGGAQTIAFGGSLAGNVNVRCSTSIQPRYCKLSINSGLGLTGYHLRISSIYGTSAVSVTAGTAANDFELLGAQVVIDSTGKAADVLRRIKVRVPFTNMDMPDAALQIGDDICKRLEVNTATSTAAPDPSVSTIPACQL